MTFDLFKHHNFDFFHIHYCDIYSIGDKGPIPLPVFGLSLSVLGEMYECVSLFSATRRR